MLGYWVEREKTADVLDADVLDDFISRERSKPTRVFITADEAAQESGGKHMSTNSAESISRARRFRD